MKTYGVKVQRKIDDAPWLCMTSKSYEYSLKYFYEAIEEKSLIYCALVEIKEDILIEMKR